MAENKPFVINDRRKFTPEGEPRPDASQDSPRINTPGPAHEMERQEQDAGASSAAGPVPVPSPATPLFYSEPEPGSPESVAAPPVPDDFAELAEADEPLEDLPPAPSAEETQQVTRAYDATVDRLDTAMRATNPGGERLPPMNFERMVQSLYMQSLLQLGGAAEPGQPPRVDIIGARQTIDMLSVLAEKVAGNLNEAEDKLLQSALFELRMGFLEVTQALARQAASRQPGGRAGSPAQTGPSIVR